MKKINFNFILILFLVFFGVLNLNISRAQASTLYFNGAVDSDWSTLGNWWNDSGSTSPAANLPASTDDVIVTQGIYSNSGSSASVNTMIVNGFQTTTMIPITASNGVTFNDLSRTGGTIFGDATFNGSSYNYGTITGNVAFYGSSYNDGTISGDVTFNDSSNNGNNGTINGNATFMYASGGTITLTGYQIWGGHITGLIKDADGNPITNWIFNNSSYNHGTVTGNATFNDSSYNQGTVNGDATFTYVLGDTITLNSGLNWGTVKGLVKNANGDPITNWIFDGSSYNFGIITGNPTFNDSSANYGTITGDAIFNGTSNNSYGGVSPSGIINGNATFNDTSYNSYSTTITGNAIFNDSSYNNGAITGTATFMNISGDTITVADGQTWYGTIGSMKNANGDPITNWIFDGSSYNQGTITGNVIFNNDSSYNDGTINGDVTFAYISGDTFTVADGYGWYGTIVGTIKNANGDPITNWIFNGSSYNYGTFTGNATFNGTSINYGFITGDVIFNDSSKSDIRTTQYL